MTRQASPVDGGLVCPFCAEDDFDSVGLAIHLGVDCPQYDHACRLASDNFDRRATQPGEQE